MLGCTATSSFYPGVSVAGGSHLAELFKMKSRTESNDVCSEMWKQLTALFNTAFIVFFCQNKVGVFLAKIVIFTWGNSTQL